jgi:hypothetical protein
LIATTITSAPIGKCMGRTGCRAPGYSLQAGLA